VVLAADCSSDEQEICSQTIACQDTTNIQQQALHSADACDWGRSVPSCNVNVNAGFISAYRAT